MPDPEIARVRRGGIERPSLWALGEAGGSGRGPVGAGYADDVWNGGGGSGEVGGGLGGGGACHGRWKLGARFGEYDMGDLDEEVAVSAVDGLLMFRCTQGVPPGEDGRRIGETGGVNPSSSP